MNTEPISIAWEEFKFGLNDDDHVAVIVGVPGALAGVGVSSKQVCAEIDGEPAYQLLERLDRERSAPKLGMPIAMKFVDATTTITVDVVLVSGDAENSGPKRSSNAERPEPSTLAELVEASMVGAARPSAKKVEPTPEPAPMVALCDSENGAGSLPSEPKTPVAPDTLDDITDLQFVVRHRTGQMASFNTPQAQAKWDDWYRRHSGTGDALGPGGGDAAGNYDPFRT